MDSNNCHIRPTPLQAAIYRRIFRCLYDRFLDCPLSFARLLENPTYAAIADCKFLDSNGKIYALRPCTLVTENGAVHHLKIYKQLILMGHSPMTRIVLSSQMMNPMFCLNI